MVAFAAGAAATVAAYLLYKKAKKPKSIKVTYFNIQAAPGEKIRLALVLTVGKDGFTDNRINGPDWSKPGGMRDQLQPKYKQMPIITVDGVDHYQSGSMLRYFGSVLGDGSLYPVGDVAATTKIEEMIGLADDLHRAWMPNMYVGMKPAWCGYDFKDDDEKKAKVKEMREKFSAEELPKYLGFIARELKETGAFIAGPKVTIADCQLFCQLSYFERGVAEYVPKDCMVAYPEVVAYMARIKAIPAIKDWYGL